MNTFAPERLGPWLDVEAHYRHQTGGAIAIWVGDTKNLKEVWVWIPDPFIRRPNPSPRGKVETFNIREWWVIDKGLEGFVVEADAVQPENEQGRLL